MIPPPSRLTTAIRHFLAKAILRPSGDQAMLTSLTDAALRAEEPVARVEPMSIVRRPPPSTLTMVMPLNQSHAPEWVAQEQGPSRAPQTGRAAYEFRPVGRPGVTQRVTTGEIGLLRQPLGRGAICLDRPEVDELVVGDAASCTLDAPPQERDLPVRTAERGLDVRRPDGVASKQGRRLGQGEEQHREIRSSQPHRLLDCTPSFLKSQTAGLRRGRTARATSKRPRFRGISSSGGRI